ncbi:MAG: hypothetical protein P4M07_09465 [Xanthobacteraceae bacterium]|nr:hypothetical protein [Xanthobacteraceae bacterium]
MFKIRDRRRKYFAVGVLGDQKANTDAFVRARLRDLDVVHPAIGQLTGVYPFDHNQRMTGRDWADLAWFFHALALVSLLLEAGSNAGVTGSSAFADDDAE